MNTQFETKTTKLFPQEDYRDLQLGDWLASKSFPEDETLWFVVAHIANRYRLISVRDGDEDGDHYSTLEDLIAYLKERNNMIRVKKVDITVSL